MSDCSACQSGTGMKKRQPVWYRNKRIYSGAVIDTLNNFAHNVKNKVLSISHRVYRVLGFFSSRPNWDPRSRVCPPLWFRGGHTRLQERGWGGQFGGGDRHCGPLGIFVLCGISQRTPIQKKNSFPFPSWSVISLLSIFHSSKFLKLQSLKKSMFFQNLKGFGFASLNLNTLALPSSLTFMCGVVPGRGLQRDVIYLCWPIAPSYMSPNGGRGELRFCGVSANEYRCTQEPQ